MHAGRLRVVRASPHRHREQRAQAVVHGLVAHPAGLQRDADVGQRLAGGFLDGAVGGQRGRLVDALRESVALEGLRVQRDAAHREPVLRDAVVAQQVGGVLRQAEAIGLHEPAGQRLPVEVAGGRRPVFRGAARREGELAIEREQQVAVDRVERAADDQRTVRGGLAAHRQQAAAFAVRDGLVADPEQVREPELAARGGHAGRRVLRLRAAHDERARQHRDMFPVDHFEPPFFSVCA